MVAPVIVPLLDCFATLADPRQNTKVSYRLSEIPRVVCAFRSIVITNSV
jgi:hypothetical protein